MQAIDIEAYQAGISWASECADSGQLTRLVVFRQRLERSRIMSWTGFFEGKGCCGYTPSEMVAFEILGTEQGVSRADAKDFWQRILGEDVDRTREPTYVRAFAEGALVGLH